MKSAVTFSLLVSFHGSLVFSYAINTSEPVPKKLKLVATVDGKSFFADESFGRNWTEAGEYCTGLGMKLAEVTSKSQYDVLNEAYDPEFGGGYWTSGRDAHQPRQFSWNLTGQAISNEYPPLRSYNDLEYQTCLFYWSRPHNDSALYYTPCGHQKGTLCST